jgi:P4 family phage/plasmid primase-like protien
LNFDPPVDWHPLTSSDFENFSRSGITPEMARAASVFRVDTTAGGQLIGRNGGGDYAGLVFPNIWPGETRPRAYVVRRDNPDIEYKKDGSRKEKAKYLSEPGRMNRLHIPLGIRPEWLNDTAIPIVFVEGPKKAIALWGAAWDGVPEGADLPRFIAVAVTGVSNFRGTVGKTAGANGGRRDVKGVIPDLDRIACNNGRHLIICFDANAATNENVAAALALFARELSERGGDVRIAEIPQLDGINGVDDLIGIWGHKPVLELLERARQFEDCGLIRSLSTAILKTDRFAQDAGGLLYRYFRGVYKPDGKEFIGRQVKALLEQRKLDSKWSSHRADEVSEYIRIDALRLWDRPPLNTINLKNGLYDISLQKLLPHSSAHLSSIQLPVEYDPDGKCPAWEKFIEETFPFDARAVAFEVLAWLMVPDTSIQKAVLLSGDGSNGKSVFLAAVLAFIGKNNAAAIPLHKLESDRFSVSRLVGKLANICADLPSEHLQSTSTFKAITGGDAMLAERKYADSFEVIPFARLVFSANNPPRSADASNAFFRRWLVIPFERTFEGASATPRVEMDARLANPAELSGVLNRAIAALPAIRTHGFSEPDSMRTAREDFRQVTDPLAVWLDQETVDHACAEVLKRSLLSAYNDFAVKAGRPPMSQQSFGRAVRRLRPNLQEAQRGAEKFWAYCGIGLKTKENPYGPVH